VALEKAQLDYTDAIQKNANDRAALAAYQQAQIDYQQAKANYDSLADTAGSDANSKIQAAAAQLEQAKANLAKLTNPATAADLAAAQASIDQAKANLAKLTAPATETDIAIQEAAVTQAEAAVKQAELNLEQATLRAPFAGLVTDVSIVPGSQVNAATPAISLMDVSTMHVKMLLNENDVVRAKLGQPVQLSIDSLPDWQATGAVDYIAPSAQKVNGVVTYDVKVTFANSDPRIKAGMTANLTIVVANKKGVLLVPNTALLPKGAGHVVQVPNADGKGFTEVDVTTGLTDGTNTEIVSGLSEGQRIIAVPTSAVPKPRGFFGG
jgi:HlyD family secretion protein